MGKWQVSSNCVGNEMLYQVYRIIDDNEVDHSGNREVVASYKAKSAAELHANVLNRMETES